MGRARKIDKTALVAQRTKRIVAIATKLMRFPNMKLSKMHDIAGCRAVMAHVTLVEKLSKVYEEATAKNAKRGGVFVKKYDYISAPKSDGYRGIHLVYKYRSDSRKLKPFDGLRVEIQLRSRLQHAWATAVEAVDFYSGQALKSNVGQDSWKRFFALSSCAFALIEGRPPVPGIPSDAQQLKAELEAHRTEITMIDGYRTATQVIEKKSGEYFLLQLDSINRKLTVNAFDKTQLQKAQDRYTEIEQANKDKPGMQTVLVSVKSLKTLRRAYPSFFLDISEFRAHLDAWLKGKPQ